MKKNYSYYAMSVFEQASTDPSVDEWNYQDMMDYTEKIADMLVLDEDLLKRHVQEMYTQFNKEMTRAAPGYAQDVDI